MGRLTTDRNDPGLGYGSDEVSVPQNEVYIVLSEEEISKGFVRPYRDSYIHVGQEVNFRSTIESLTEHQNDYYTEANGYVAFLKYTDPDSALVGRYIKQDELDAFNKVQKYFGGCNQTTTMAKQIAETYARDPTFYGATYCTTCQKHRPVSEFRWSGTNEVLGS